MKWSGSFRGTIFLCIQVCIQGTLCYQVNAYEESKVKLVSNFCNIFMTPEIVSNFDHMVEIRRSGSTHSEDIDVHVCFFSWEVESGEQ